MNKQQLFSTLVGTVLTVGAITVASAGNPPWRYDADTDRIFYSFSGPDHKYGEADYPSSPQAGDLPWRYDADTDRIFYSFSGPEIRNSDVTDNSGNPQARNLPWYYDADSDRIFYTFGGSDTRDSK